MTQEQWRDCEDLDAMLDAVAGSPRTTDRCLRRFARACVRRVWDLLQDEHEEPVRRAVEFAERLAEGEADMAERATIAKEFGWHPIVWAESGPGCPRR